MTAPHLARITIYPIKSLDGVVVEHADVLANGALRHDRRFAIRDREGGFINGKRMSAVHMLRSTLDLTRGTVSFEAHGVRSAPTSSTAERVSSATSFHLDGDRAELERWLGAYLGLDGPVRLDEKAAGGWPDDADAPGPTVVSTATLATVAAWFPGLSLDEARRRFRANLEIGGVEPFWEDRLYGEAGRVVGFEIGGARFEGTNPCQRCVVPSRDTLTGEVTAKVARTCAAHREQTLPPRAARSRFDHYYRLAVNTRLAALADNGIVRVGDEVRVIP